MLFVPLLIHIMTTGLWEQEINQSCNHGQVF